MTYETKTLAQKAVNSFRRLLQQQHGAPPETGEQRAQATARLRRGQAETVEERLRKASAVQRAVREFAVPPEE